MQAISAPAASPAPAPVRAARRRQWYRPLVRNPLVLGGLILVVFFVLVALFANVVAPADPVAMNAAKALEGPSAAAPFGTDRFGRDVLSRAIHGARASLLVGIGSIAIAAVIGTLVGLAAGYFGGTVDNVLGRIMDIFFTFPSLILAIAISAALGLGIQNALLAIAITYWPAFGRVVRGAALAERGKDYVEAARVVGASDVRVVRGHVLPNVLSPIIVQFTVAISQAIIIESSLSYLGLGTQPPTPSWGTMINEGRTFLDTAPWISVFPGAAIMGAVLAFNLLGDGLRDILDPRSRPV
ncbi:MAG: ABC transporter permease [Chloroflexi bacterium]|nr:ABC transporter permease [Chloroflexota bacterium]